MLYFFLKILFDSTSLFKKKERPKNKLAKLLKITPFDWFPLNSFLKLLKSGKKKSIFKKHCFL